MIRANLAVRVHVRQVKKKDKHEIDGEMQRQQDTRNYAIKILQIKVGTEKGCVPPT